MIHFDEKTHTYTDNNGQEYMSTTRFIHKFFPEFDKEAMAIKCAQGKNKKYKGRDPNDIIAEWDKAGAEAIEKGNFVHKAAEIYLTKGKRYVSKYKRLCSNVYKFIKNWEYELIESEKILHSPEYLISGTADLLLRGERGIVLGDWKTNKEIKKYGFKNAYPPISHLYDCNFVHYCLQLNIYRWLFESETNEIISEMKLFHVMDDNIEVYDIPRMDNEVTKMLGTIKEDPFKTLISTNVLEEVVMSDNRSIFDELAAPFPIEAYKIDKSRGFPLTSLDAQWIKERLNRVFGVFGWEFEETFVEKEEGVICHGKLTVKDGENSRSVWATGGCSRKPKGQTMSDVFKSAATESLSKCCSYIGIGNEMYKGNVPCDELDKPRGNYAAAVKSAKDAKTKEEKTRLITKVRNYKWEKGELDELEKLLG